MHTINIGQQHFNWDIIVYSWQKFTECSIYNIIDPIQKLIIVIEGTDSNLCTPDNIRIWVDHALNKGWYRETLIYKIIQADHNLQFISLAHSITEEVQMAKGVAIKHNRTPTMIQKSEISHEFSKLEKKINQCIPSVFKQLYLEMGNGQFGPDYGFFNLIDNHSGKKITIEQAYFKIHDSKIKDWNWELPQYLVPFLYWGSGIYSLIDCSDSLASVYVLDKNLKKENSTWQNCLWQHCETFMDWLQKWSDGDISGRSLWLEMYKLKGLI
ncbi:MAG: SMI1/KNR4 family protein [Saprospiraceae bacterium]|nr:SMI1/KNR4 family protein [Saprospiraceae bacterium]